MPVGHMRFEKAQHRPRRGFDRREVLLGAADDAHPPDLARPEHLGGGLAALQRATLHGIERQPAAHLHLVDIAQPAIAEHGFRHPFVAEILDQSARGKLAPDRAARCCGPDGALPDHRSAVSNHWQSCRRDIPARGSPAPSPCPGWRPSPRRRGSTGAECGDSASPRASSSNRATPAHHRGDRHRTSRASRQSSFLLSMALLPAGSDHIMPSSPTVIGPAKRLGASPRNAG